MKICTDGRIWGQTDKSAGSHLGILSDNSGYSPEHYQANKGHFAMVNKLYHQANRTRRLLRRRESDRILKVDVLTFYSVNGTHQCVKCGIADVDVLNIDHINGGGRKHREEISGNALGQNLYRWLKRNDYPNGYQTLCANCNLKKAIEAKRNGRSKLE